MACRACEECAIDYPLDKTNCPLCKGMCTYTATREPMPGWEYEVQRRRVIDSDLKMNRLPGIHQDRLVKFRGQWYITTESLTFCGYDAVAVGDVIRVQGAAGDIFWEIEGRAKQKGVEPGHPRYIAGWWIQRLVIPNFDDLTPEEFIRGGQET